MDNTPLTPEQLELQELRKKSVELEALKQRNAILEAEKAEQDQIIAEQLEQLDLAEAQKGNPLPVVSSDKKKYQVLAAKFQFEGKEYQADDLKTNKDLLKSLIHGESGLIKEIK